MTSKGMLSVGVASVLLAVPLSAATSEASTDGTDESFRLVDKPDERVCLLENGLTVILKAHRTAPVVSVRMYCRTGSIYEQEYLGSGLSHLFEHLLHGGETTHRTEAESREVLDAIGGDSNAYTSFDVTCYYINAAKEHAGTAIEMLGDWITCPTFPQEAFDREWEVVQRELERDVDNPDRQLFYLMLKTMYREHPVRFPVIGHQAIVQKLIKEAIVAYYHRMYVPDNIVVCIAGDIDLDATLAMVQKEFASFSRRALPTIVLPEEPEMSAPRQAIKRMNVQAAILRLAWPSIRLTDKDLYALDLLSYVLTQGDSSRLVRAIRDTGLSYTIDSFSWTPEWAKGVFAITARLAPERIGEVQSAIAGQLEILQRDLISDEELKQAKRQKATEHVFASQTAESIASMMASDYISTGDASFSAAYVEGIQRVTAEQVREMARKYLRPDRLATIQILPETESVDQQAAVTDSGPESVRKIILDNGLRCLIRRDPTTPLVSIQSFSLGGVVYENPNTNGLSNLAALLAPRGTSTRSAQDIARFFDSRGGYLQGNSGNNTIYFQAQVLKDDFEPAMDVFADVICHPTFPKEELETYRPQVLDQIRRINEQWRSELFAYFKSRLFEHSPYRFQSTGSLDVVANASTEAVADFYHHQVTGPQTVLAIFGDVDPKQAESLVRKLFADLPANKPVSLNVPPETPLDEARLYVKRKNPDRQVAGIGIGFHGMRASETADTVPVAVLDTIISGYRLPTGWLHESLRGGNRSYVYEVHAVNFPGVIPGYFTIYAACQPEKATEVYRIITEQLDRARSGQFSAEELERAKTIIVTTELMQNQTNSDCAQQAALDELYGLGYDYHDGFADRIRAVTLEDVARVAKRYFTHPVVTVVTPSPEAVDLGMKPLAIDEDTPPQSP